MEIWINGLELTVNIVEWFWENWWPELFWWLISWLIAFWVARVTLKFPERSNKKKHTIHFRPLEFACNLEWTYTTEWKGVIPWASFFIKWTIISEYLWIPHLITEIKIKKDWLLYDCDVLTLNKFNLNNKYRDVKFWENIIHISYLEPNKSFTTSIMFGLSKEILSFPEDADMSRISENISFEFYIWVEWRMKKIEVSKINWDLIFYDNNARKSL